LTLVEEAVAPWL